MRTQAMDTALASEQVEVELLRRMPTWRKLQLAGAMNRMVDMLALRGLQRRYPTASEPELHRRLADFRLGPELALRVYGPLSMKLD